MSNNKKIEILKSKIYDLEADLTCLENDEDKLHKIDEIIDCRNEYQGLLAKKRPALLIFGLVFCIFYGISLFICLPPYIIRGKKMDINKEKINQLEKDRKIIHKRLLDNGVILEYESNENKVDNNQKIIVSNNMIQEKATDDSEEYKLECTMHLISAQSKVNHAKISQKRKDEMLLILSNIDINISNVKTEENKELIINQIKDVMSYFKKRRIKLILIIVLAASVVIAFANILINAITTKQEKIARENMYNELSNLVYEYKTNEYDYKIESYISYLKYHYDIKAIEQEYINASNYYDLKELMGSYDGSSESNSKIKEALNKIQKTYKDISLISKDYEKIKVYISKIDAPINSYVLDKINISSSIAIRQNVEYLYKNANKSGYWNFENYINRLAIPHFVYGITYKYSNYELNWYYDESENGQMLAWNLPTPKNYVSSYSYYFDADYSSIDNTITFSLEKQDDKKYIVKLCTVNYIWYDDVKNNFCANIYLDGLGESYDFIASTY